MARFRKRPVEIDAALFDGSLLSVADVCEGHRIILHGDTLTIPTLEGDMVARRGDFVIRGVQGEIYPCKPDIFAATYEEA